MTKGLPKPLRVSETGLGLVSWTPEMVDENRPPCLSAVGQDRDKWTSLNDGLRAEARVACLDKCPLAVRMECLRRALDSKCEEAVYGGHNFAGARGRKLARQELERYEAGQGALT